ncbi:hypothetical protein [Anaeromicropila herbilytica]|uniref:Uncharacterized protein n=1 Tax=Anaeromicropila herbilytica TaxID=2785025 RepID=A0A7R7EHR1_9FIRM|nr:hypothetical protein [Anaeromicropila herbilytica]BCN28948.1 hypothetical protein bsdtb5_02430 [Anaeromicropila herbilytica]
MFRDKYKLDNDEITPSKELLESLATQMEHQKRNEPVPIRHSTLPNIIKKYRSIAAILILFILSFSSYQLLSNNNLTGTRSDTDSSNESSSITSNSDQLTRSTNPSTDTTTDGANLADGNNSSTLDESKIESFAKKDSSDTSTYNGAQSQKVESDKSLASSGATKDTTQSKDSKQALKITPKENSNTDTAKPSDHDSYTSLNKEDSLKDSKESKNSKESKSSNDTKNDTSNDESSSPYALTASNNSFLTISVTDITSITVSFTDVSSDYEITQRADIDSIFSTLKGLDLSQESSDNNLDGSILATLRLHLGDDSENEVSLSNAAIKIDGIWYTSTTENIQAVLNYIQSSIQN